MTSLSRLLNQQQRERSAMSVTKVIKGVLCNYFETGCEGTYWSVQDENHIDDKGMYDYEGLNILSPRTLVHMTIYGSDNHMIYSGNPSLVNYHQLDITEDDSLAAYLKSVTYETGYTRTQFQLGNMWVHNLPADFDMDLWKDIFIINSGKYTAEVTIKER